MRQSILLVALLSAGCTSSLPTSPDANARATTAVNMPTSIALTPHLAVEPASPVVGTTATLSASVDDAIAPLTYFWTFGDGYSTSTAIGSVEHVYAGTGLITSSVRITDATSRTGSAAVLVTVQEKPVAPTPTEPPPPPKPAPAPAVFALSMTCGNEVNRPISPVNLMAKPTLDGRLVTPDLLRRVDWDFGDGMIQKSTASLNVVHIYQRRDTFMASVVVELTTGQQGQTTTPCVIQ